MVYRSLKHVIEVRLAHLESFYPGCVRLWDSRGLQDEYDRGTVLVETDNDIACMSFGDVKLGEYRLVV